MTSAEILQHLMIIKYKNHIMIYSFFFQETLSCIAKFDRFLFLLTSIY